MERWGTIDLAMNLLYEAVEHTDAAATPKQLLADEAADEARSARDQDLFHLSPP